MNFFVFAIAVALCFFPAIRVARFFCCCFLLLFFFLKNVYVYVCLHVCVFGYRPQCTCRGWWTITGVILCLPSYLRQSVLSSKLTGLRASCNSPVSLPISLEYWDSRHVLLNLDFTRVLGNFSFCKHFLSIAPSPHLSFIVLIIFVWASVKWNTMWF